PNQGTSVEITLPVLLRPDRVKQDIVEPHHENERKPATQPATAAIKTNYSILIVEDNKELLTFLSRHFGNMYHVLAAANGAMALRKIHKLKPDVIISDVKMPKMDGLELCNQIKNDERLSYIP